MAASGEDLQPSARYAPGQLAPARDGQPGIGLAPDDERGNGDLAVERLDLVGIALVALGDLAIEGRLARGAKPGSDERAFDVGSERSGLSGRDVGPQDALVDRGRQLLEDREVLADETVEGEPHGASATTSTRASGGHRAAVHQVRAQRRGAADVVSDDGRALEGPVVEQGRQPLPVPRQRHVLPGALVRGAEAEQVEDVDGEALGEIARGAPPRPRGPRRAVHEDHRWALPEPVPGDRARVGLEALPKHPPLHAGDASQRSRLTPHGTWQSTWSSSSRTPQGRWRRSPLRSAMPA